MKNNNNNLNFNGISPEKIKIINDIIEKSQNMSQDNLIPYFLNASATASANGITFTDAETDIIVNSLKTNMTPAQANKIDTVRRLSKILATNNSKS